jgi:hypothetical protein
MGIAWRWNKKALKRSAFESVLHKVGREIFLGSNSRKHRMGDAARSPAKPHRQSFASEAKLGLQLSADAPFNPPQATV